MTRPKGDAAIWQDGWAQGHRDGWEHRGVRNATLFGICGALGGIVLEHLVVALWGLL